MRRRRGRSRLAISLVVLLGAQCMAAGPASAAPVSQVDMTSRAGGWTLTGPMVAQNGLGTATALPGGSVLVAGGVDAGGDGIAQSAAEIYDPASNRWSLTTPMHHARAQDVAAPLPRGRVLVAGGDAQASGSAEIYDPASATWTDTGSLHTNRGIALSAPLPGGKILVAGGFSDIHNTIYGLWVRSAEVYDPQTGKWTMTGSMHATHTHGTATALADGRVLVAGGDYGDSAEIYDPQTRAWTQVAPMRVGRSYASAALLPGGRVLVAGGQTGSDPHVNPNIADAEIYDPATDTWTETAPLPQGSGSGAAGTLPDGRIVISAQVYDPASGTWAKTCPAPATLGNFWAVPLPGGRILFNAAAAAAEFTPGSRQGCPRPPPNDPTVALRIASRTLHHRHVRLRLRCRGAPRCEGAISLSTRIRGGRTRRVGHRRYNLRRGIHELGVRLGRGARRSLRRRGHLRVIASARLDGRSSRAAATLHRQRRRHGRRGRCKARRSPRGCRRPAVPATARAGRGVTLRRLASGVSDLAVGDRYVWFNDGPTVKVFDPAEATVTDADLPSGCTVTGSAAAAGRVLVSCPGAAQGLYDRRTHRLTYLPALSYGAAYAALGRYWISIVAPKFDLSGSTTVTYRNVRTGEIRTPSGRRDLNTFDLAPYRPGARIERPPGHRSIYLRPALRPASRVLLSRCTRHACRWSGKAAGRVAWLQGTRVYCYSLHGHHPVLRWDIVRQPATTDRAIPMRTGIAIRVGKDLDLYWAPAGRR